VRGKSWVHRYLLLHHLPELVACPHAKRPKISAEGEIYQAFVDVEEYPVRLQTSLAARGHMLGYFTQKGTVSVEIVVAWPNWARGVKAG
jgi:hypothetical protein